MQAIAGGVVVGPCFVSSLGRPISARDPFWGCGHDKRAVDLLKAVKNLKRSEPAVAR